MHAAAGRRISIVGASQGGIVPRWALRLWPDTRRMVDDLIGLAPTNHGVPAGDIVARCAPTGCPVASMQQAAGSRFPQALNSRAETFPGVSFTQIRSRDDELLLSGATPASRASESLTGPGTVTDVAIQNVCPDDHGGHVATWTTSNTAWAIALDALDHDGPADLRRVPVAACATPLMPGVALAGPRPPAPPADPRAPMVLHEAAVAAYAFDRRRPRVSVLPRRLTAGAADRLRIRVTTGGGDPLPGARIAVLGRVVRTRADGRAAVLVRPVRRDRHRVRVTVGALPATVVAVAVR